MAIGNKLNDPAELQALAADIEEERILASYDEFPLYDNYEACPTARYVGGTSRYLCECERPVACEGFQETIKDGGL